MDFPALIDSYGYATVLAGAFLEGETILALAGLAAYRGYLDFTVVVGLAMLMGFAGDQFYFYLGRTRGHRVLARFPDARERAERFDAMLARWHAPLIIAIRFLWGFRIVGPILLGMGRVPAWKFMVYNFIGAAIWAPFVAGIGYLFGSALEAVLHDLRKAELWGLVLLLCAGLAGVLAHGWRARARARGLDAARRRLP
jgi:membrane protein DedA with SNARE-associated domain